MSKKIVLIESDTAFSLRIRADFEARGFSVFESSDGKASIDLVKRERPDLVVLAVELSAGQSGYIVCGKLKKDEELKKIPIIITGKDPEGFESHKRLKARAEDYLKKPFEFHALLEKVGALIGLPRTDSADLVLEEDESLGLTSLGEDEPLTSAAETRAGDPDLDMLDAAFGTLSNEAAIASPEADPSLDEGLLEEPPPVGASSEPLLELDNPSASEVEAEPLLELDDSRVEVPEEIALDALDPIVEAPEGSPPPPPAGAVRTPRSPSPAAAAFDDAELRALRERVQELESRTRDLEDEVAAKTNELEAVRSTAGGKDKEFYALREQASRKDKELLRLKQDLTERERELVEVKDKELVLDQRVSELTTDLAKRDAQIKTQNQRAEAFSADRKRLDAALAQSKDESRQIAADLAAAQGELERAQEANAELDRAAEAARADAQATGAELERVRGELSARDADLSAMRADAERLGSDAARAAQLDEEALVLRARISELEAAASKNEDRVVKAYQKIKLDEKLREKTKKALAVALSMLDEGSSGDAELKQEEEAAAS